MTRKTTDDPKTWGAETSITINGYTLPVFGADSKYLPLIEASFAYIPLPHVKLVRRVVVGDVVGRTITKGGATINRPGVERLELSSGAMDNPQKLFRARDGKTMLHMTVLHETGHHVDNDAHDYLARVPPQVRTQAEAWFKTKNYAGAHIGPNETRAELYWRLFALTSDVPEDVLRAVRLSLGIP